MFGVPHNACREIGILRELKHENIVNLVEVLINPDKQMVSMVLEWAEYDLKGIIDRVRIVIYRYCISLFFFLAFRS
jgi:serine/threonine protein kinase